MNNKCGALSLIAYNENYLKNPNYKSNSYISVVGQGFICGL